MAQDWGSDGIFGTIGKGIREYNADSLSISTMRSRALNFIKDYIQYNAAIVFGSTASSFAGKLEDMITVMEDDNQTVKGNTIDEGGHTFVGSVTPVLEGGKFVPTQMILEDDYIKVECIRASAGADTWRLTSMRLGQVGVTATTGVSYPPTPEQDLAGISFKIDEPVSGAYAVGDYFYVGPTTNNEQAIIQTFFRDALKRTLPYSLTGSETISDSLARDNSQPSS